MNEMSAGAERHQDVRWATNFAEYWPVYLAQHSHPRTRLWHYTGTLLGIGVGLLVFGFQYAHNAFFEALLLGGFSQILVTLGVLLASHWVVEGSPPRPLGGPGKPRAQVMKEVLWSARANIKMLWAALNERVPGEFEKHSLSSHS
jgi:hypothetical protein